MSCRPPGRRSGRSASATSSRPADPPRHGERDAARDRPHGCSTRRAPPTADVVIVGAGIAGLPSRASWRRVASATWSFVDRGYPGGGATGRNVARLRAMQLTEELTHVARACQAKYDRMGEELGFNVLFYRLGYAWVLYEADEVERCARSSRCTIGSASRAACCRPTRRSVSCRS